MNPLPFTLTDQSPIKLIKIYNHTMAATNNRQLCAKPETNNSNPNNGNNPPIHTDKSVSVNDRNHDLEKYFMKQALKVAKRALDIGEVPVGCVIVLRRGEGENEHEDLLSSVKVSKSTKLQSLQGSLSNLESEEEWKGQEREEEGGGKGGGKDDDEKRLERKYISSSQVILSHGANQVNATRDATRHAECIAIDRMLTGSLVSDKLRLPQHVFLKNLEKRKTQGRPNNGDDHDTNRGNDNSDSGGGKSVKTNYGDDDNDDYDYESDTWINVPSDPNHWKNKFGWGSGQLYKRDIFQKCDLYVTCEPCIMVRYLSFRHIEIMSFVIFSLVHNEHLTFYFYKKNYHLSIQSSIHEPM